MVQKFGAQIQCPDAVHLARSQLGTKYREKPKKLHTYSWEQARTKHV